jgi:PAS domain S-box-containing protein
MVALLWGDGHCEAAIRLEQIWNRLARRYSFTLRCAYPMTCFGSSDHDEFFSRICAEHTHVESTDDISSLDPEDERLRMVSALQQKADSLRKMVKARRREVSRRKAAEEKLRRSEEFARKVLESSIDCVTVLDLEGRLEYISPPGQRALEIEDAAPFLGRRWAELWQPEDRQRAEAAVAAAHAGGVGSFQADCPTLTGTPKSWDVKITPALDSEGRIERLIAVSRDITELRRAQAAVLQAEKLAATGRLAATIAHEINNPLEAVTNCIYLVRTTDGLPEGVRQHLELADRELARVAQIAQQTLGFYRDSSKEQWLRVSDVIHDIVRLYEHRLRSRQLTIEVAAESDAKIYMKQGDLKQALSNLLVNAIDASNPGGRLRLHLQQTTNPTNGVEPGVRITLADNGAGIAPEVQRHIFEPFFTTKADTGTGIGLWVTRSLIEKRGGYLRFRSRQGDHAGTVMSFFLPVTHEHMAGASL